MDFPRPNSPMNCFMVSIDCVVRLLDEMLLLSVDGLITVLKSPLIITGQSEQVEIDVKKR